MFRRFGSEMTYSMIAAGIFVFAFFTCLVSAAKAADFVAPGDHLSFESQDLVSDPGNSGTGTDAGGPWGNSPGAGGPKQQGPESTLGGPKDPWGVDVTSIWSAFSYFVKYMLTKVQVF
ncbi:MAG TPA: hypothetical protein VGB30_06815 [bacterium]|jgi:hypothetical protein